MPGSAIGAGSSLLGGLFSSNSASKAADAQVKSTQLAIDAQKQALSDAVNRLSPYSNFGQSALPWLTDRMGQFADNVPLPTVPNPVNISQADLEATPGYGFTLSQGLKSVQNSAAAKGLGVSGSALKGAASYATGLADSTYQNRFMDALQQNAQLFGQQQQNFANQTTNTTNAYNRLMGIANVGQNSAALTASAGLQTGNNISGAYIGQGNAQAAGYLAQGKAMSNAATGAGAFLSNGIGNSGNGSSNSFSPFLQDPYSYDQSALTNSSGGLWS